MDSASRSSSDVEVIDDTDYDSTDSLSEISEQKKSLTIGEETYNIFVKVGEFVTTCKDLEKFLTGFANRVLKINSTLTLVKASRELAKSLRRARQNFETDKDRIKKNDPPDPESTVLIRFSDLKGISRTVNDFNSAITDFEDYSDKKGYRALREFNSELSALTNSLEYFGDGISTVHVTEFVGARIDLLKSDLKGTTFFLKRFNKMGIQCIKYAQKRSIKVTSNAATVATFFAGVAATTVQFSMQNKSSMREIAINVLWFSSLTLSTCSAISAMLALSWRSAVFSDPKRRSSWYIRFWIRSGYLILLVASVITFLAGLLMFVYDSQPDKAIFWSITGITAFCMIGIASVAIRFIKGRMALTKLHKEFKRELRLVLHKSSEANEEDPGRTMEQPFGKEGTESPVKTDAMSASSGTSGQQPKSPWMTSRAITKFRSVIGHQAHDLERGSGRKYMEDLVFFQSLRLVGSKHQRPQLKRDILHMQFSPNGLLLVVCYKFSCYVYEAKTPSSMYPTVLSHPARRKAKQAEWSPDGKYLLTRLSDGVMIWPIKNDKDFAVDDRREVYGLPNTGVLDIKWVDNKEFLILMRNRQVKRMSVDGEPPILYDDWLNDELLLLHHLYTIPESNVSVIVVTRMLEDPPGARVDCVLAFNMDKKDRENQSQFSGYWSMRRLPLLDTFMSLSIGPLVNSKTKNLRYMLIGYKTKLPEIWTIDVFMGALSLEKKQVQPHSGQLQPLPGKRKSHMAEYGDVFFIGPKQETIACMHNETMHFWHLETREHFHKLKVVEKVDAEDLPIATWTAQPNGLKIVTAYRDSTLQVWEANEGDEKKDQSVENRQSGSQPTVSTAILKDHRSAEPKAEMLAKHDVGDPASIASPKHPESA